MLSRKPTSARRRLLGITQPDAGWGIAGSCRRVPVGRSESTPTCPVGGLQEAADAFLVGRSVHNPTFLERFTDGWLGNYRDLEIIACSLLYSPLGDGCHCRLLSFCDGDLLAVCMNNSRDLGEPLTERSRGIGTIFRQ